MKRYDPLSDPGADDDEIVCDICGGVIPLGSEYVTVAAENEEGEIVGHLIAHAACAESLDENELGAIIGAIVDDDNDSDDPAAMLDDILPLPNCCLCGDRIGEADYINFVEPMHPGNTHSPLVATTFHTACYRTDPDGVQRAIDEEIQKQRARQEESS